MITSNGYEIEIQYGLNQQRISQKLFSGTGADREFVKEKQFLSGLAEKTIFADNTTETINYITSPEGLTAIEVIANTGNREWYWVFTDHLGSITTLLRESDGQKFEMSYDAWGNRRDPATWINYTTTQPEFIIDRGFTGHEHLDIFGLINMNGRVYDPVAARFLSPDPYIQAPGMPQNYNGYIYCFNNPLRYTDPSGNFFVLPFGSWSEKGGFDMGVSAGVGLSKISSAQITIGYSSKSNSGYITVGATIAGFTGYVGYSTSGGLIAGVSAGLGVFGIDNKSPLNSNAFTAGLSFSSQGGVAFNAFGFTYSRYGLGFDLSVGISRPYNAYLKKLPNGSHFWYIGDWLASNEPEVNMEFPPGLWLSGVEVISHKDYSVVVRSMSLPYGYYAQGGGGNGIDGDDIWVGATGTYLSTVGNAGQNAWWWKDAKGAYRSTKLLQVGSNGKYVQGVQGFRNSYAIAGKAASLTKIAGNTLGAVGVGISVYDMTQNGINVSNSMDAIMGATTFIPVVGWVISGTYFTASFITELSTGKSISEHAQGWVNTW